MSKTEIILINWVVLLHCKTNTLIRAGCRTVRRKSADTVNRFILENKWNWKALCKDGLPVTNQERIGSLVMSNGDRNAIAAKISNWTDSDSAWPLESEKYHLHTQPEVENLQILFTLIKIVTKKKFKMLHCSISSYIVLNGHMGGWSFWPLGQGVNEI